MVQCSVLKNLLAQEIKKEFQSVTLKYYFSLDNIMYLSY